MALTRLASADCYVTAITISGIRSVPRGTSVSRRREKYALTDGEMTHYGLYRLAWADVRRTRD
ncbi:MAG: hypothetical protein IJG84_02505 [Kiritimatiellae bacterium]|nr:hypothetical protein [Kiritimatiellia bacterium]